MSTPVIDLQAVRFQRAAESDYDRTLGKLSEESKGNHFAAPVFETIRDVMVASRDAFERWGLPMAYGMMDIAILMGRYMPSFVFSTLEGMTKNTPDRRINYLNVVSNFDTRCQMPSFDAIQQQTMLNELREWSMALEAKYEIRHVFQLVNVCLITELVNQGFVLLEYSFSPELDTPFCYTLVRYEYCVEVSFDYPTLLEEVAKIRNAED
jgi:hypothetical protein